MTTALRIGQSADPDDAFMAWGLADLLAADNIEAAIEFADIESLNRGAIDGRLDLTALSVGAYPGIADRYRILRCGASFGDAYGPLVVTASAAEPGIGALQGLRIGIPGTNTTAAMLLRIYAGERYEEVVYPFDTILDAVIDGKIDAGLIIHEGQLVYERLGLRPLFEPAAEWSRQEQLPVPLGVVAVRRDLDGALQERLAGIFLRSVRRAFENPQPALEFAARHARGLDRATLEEYVYRYVNASTLDMGAAGERAVNRLFERAAQAGLLGAPPVVDLL